MLNIKKIERAIIDGRYGTSNAINNNEALDMIREIEKCRAALKVVADFPITSEANMDAINMRAIAVAALK